MEKLITAQEAVRKRILQIANEKGLSINKIATNCFINTSTLTSIINGHSKHSEITTISRICYGLGVSITEFFNSELFNNVNDLED